VALGAFFYFNPFSKKFCENNLWPKVFSIPSPFGGAIGHGAAAQCCGAISLGAPAAASVAASHPHRQRGKVVGPRCGATSVGAATADTTRGPALLSTSSIISNRHPLVLVYRRLAAAAARRASSRRPRAPSPPSTSRPSPPPAPFLLLFAPPAAVPAAP